MVLPWTYGMAGNDRHSQGKQGIAIALPLPEETACSIHKKIFDKLSIAQLKADAGFETLKEFLDEKFKKEGTADSWDKFDDWGI